MAAREKFTSLKFKNRAGVIYDNNWIAGVEYENNKDETEDHSEEYKEDEDYSESKNDENEDQDEYLESEEDINEDELEYLEENIKVNYYNPVNE